VCRSMKQVVPVPSREKEGAMIFAIVQYRKTATNQLLTTRQYLRWLGKAIQLVINVLTV